MRYFKLAIVIVVSAVMLSVLLFLRGSASTGSDLQRALHAYTSSHGYTMNLGITRFAVVQKYALADWIAGDTGGQALFVNTGSWSVIRTGGGGVFDAQELEVLGVPAASATQLVQNMQTIESASPDPACL